MMLLAAATLDANNEILPLGIALVPSESENAWGFFLRNFAWYFMLNEMDSLVVLSDRCKGLINAVNEYLPKAFHGMCCKHLWDNIQQNFGVKARDRFWGLARAKTEVEFNDRLIKLETEVPRGAEAAAYL